MGLEDYITRKLQQEAAKVYTYDEQFITINLDAIKRSAIRFVSNNKHYTDFGNQNEAFGPISEIAVQKSI